MRHHAKGRQGLKELASRYHDMEAEMQMEEEEDHHTVVHNGQEARCKYWATRSSVRSSCSHRSLICWVCPARLARVLGCAALFRSLARSLTPELVGN